MLHAHQGVRNVSFSKSFASVLNGWPLIESTKFVLGVNMILQSDFSIKVKGQTKRGRQVDKRTGTGREIKNKYLADFTGRYYGAHKYGCRQN